MSTSYNLLFALYFISDVHVKRSFYEKSHQSFHEKKTPPPTATVSLSLTPVEILKGTLRSIKRDAQ